MLIVPSSIPKYTFLTMFTNSPVSITPTTRQHTAAHTALKSGEDEQHYQTGAGHDKNTLRKSVLPGMSMSCVFTSFQSHVFFVSKSQSTSTPPLSVTTGPCQQHNQSAYRRREQLTEQYAKWHFTKISINTKYKTIVIMANTEIYT